MLVSACLHCLGLQPFLGGLCLPSPYPGCSQSPGGVHLHRHLGHCCILESCRPTGSAFTVFSSVLSIWLICSPLKWLIGMEKPSAYCIKGPCMSLATDIPLCVGGHFWDPACKQHQAKWHGHWIVEVSQNQARGWPHRGAHTRADVELLNLIGVCLQGAPNGEYQLLLWLLQPPETACHQSIHWQNIF